MDTKHTPGPWRYIPDDTVIVSETAKDDWLDAPVRVINTYAAMGGDDTQADARLMAAAPELLDACRAAFDQATHDPMARLDQPQLSMMRRAIAKATGQE